MVESRMGLQSMVRTHFPLKMAMRNLRVLLQAPNGSVDAMTWVTLGLQSLLNTAPVNLANLAKVSWDAEMWICRVVQYEQHDLRANFLFFRNWKKRGLNRDGWANHTFSAAERAEPHITHPLVTSGGAIQSSSSFCIKVVGWFGGWWPFLKKLKEILLNKR